MDNKPDSSERREFLRQTGLGTALLLTGISSLSACKATRSMSHIQGGMVGANYQAGHRLRSVAELMKLPVQETVTTDVLIVGGGVAGLSARRWLAQQGVRDVLLLEMAAQTGGNAAYGQNTVSAYPFGAHYLPIPDLRNQELVRFLKDINAITGFTYDGLPLYNDYYLCHDPEERLYINGFWQEGLVPETGVPEDDKKQIKAFFALVDQYKQAKGSDGLDAFMIPLDRSSADSQFRDLDKIAFTQFLNNHKFTSPYLRWYLNYCCRDDYGATLDTTSAWAGIHYFASRKGRAANAKDSDILTWPEGNGFLTDKLRGQSHSPIRQNILVYELRPNNQGVLVHACDVVSNQTIVIQARKVIVATPQFITRHLLPERPQGSGFRYAPWVVANLTISGLPQGRGLPLCWDNVLYNTSSVGYITANHQDLRDSLTKVVTYYKPLTDQDPDTARRMAYNTSYEEWLTQVLDELEIAHPSLRDYVSQADIWVWGHGMIAPSPGFIWGSERQLAQQPIDNNLFFAHSDLSGISIFEEAFDQGIRAASQVVSTL